MQTAVKAFVAGEMCPASGVSFRSRVRVLLHLRLRSDAIGARRQQPLSGEFPEVPAELRQLSDLAVHALGDAAARGCILWRPRALCAAAAVTMRRRGGHLFVFVPLRGV